MKLLKECKNIHDIKKAVQEIDEINKELDVLSEKVYPYGYAVEISEIVDDARRIDGYTEDSKAIIKAELNGCIRHINHKIKFLQEKDVKIQYTFEDKKIETVKESIANTLQLAGLAVLL